MKIERESLLLLVVIVELPGFVVVRLDQALPALGIAGIQFEFIAFPWVELVQGKITEGLP